MIPDFQSIMLPLLKQISDGKEYRLDTIVDLVAKEFKITDEERKKLLPSGQTFIFGSRVGWARTYMKKAGLIDTPKRGCMIITDRGLSVLKQNPPAINIAYLRQFQAFIEWQSMKKDNNQNNDDEFATQPLEQTIAQTIAQTPEELLEISYQAIRKDLAQDILDKIFALSPLFFERLVVELLVKMGYGGTIQDAGMAIGKSGDEGIDGTIKEDKLGLDVIYIQAKRWQSGSVVGRPEIQKFVGALAGQGAKKGIFITTSSFTKDAISYVPRNDTKIVLIDGVQLSQLMIDHNVGVAIQHLYEIKRIDNDYFEE
jgi:restriction system protein